MKPAEREPRLPSLVSAFEKFNQRISNHVDASIAFGLYMTSLRAAFREGAATEKHFDLIQQAYLTDVEIARYKEKAAQLLVEVADGALKKEGEKFVAQALHEYRVEAAKGHRAFRFRGVLEAIAGAFVWTVLLIVISVVVARTGIDLLEVYRRVAGGH